MLKLQLNSLEIRPYGYTLSLAGEIGLEKFQRMATESDVFSKESEKSYNHISMSDLPPVII